MQIELRRNGYTAIVEPANNGFAGRILLTDNVINFRGRNYSDLQRNMDEAIQEHIDKLTIGNTTHENAAQI